MEAATEKPEVPAKDTRPANRRGKGLDHTPGVSPAQKKAIGEENRRRAMAAAYERFPKSPGAQMRWVFSRNKSDDVLPEEMTLRKLLHAKFGEYMDTMVRLEAEEAKRAQLGPAGQDRPAADKVTAELLLLIDKTLERAGGDDGPGR
jgi:hypothetical protein